MCIPGCIRPGYDVVRLCTGRILAVLTVHCTRHCTGICMIWSYVRHHRMSTYCRLHRYIDAQYGFVSSQLYKWTSNSPHVPSMTNAWHIYWYLAEADLRKRAPSAAYCGALQLHIFFFFILADSKQISVAFKKWQGSLPLPAVCCYATGIFNLFA